MKEVTVILKKRKEWSGSSELTAVSGIGSMDLSLPSSHSSYSQTNINRNPPNVAAKIEHSIVLERSHNRRSLNWKYKEDIALCQSWVRCSENLIIGTNQIGNSLWNRIFVDFREKLPETTRTKKSLENRWTTIQDDVTKWKTIVDRVHEGSSGCTNPSDEWGVCYKAFRDDHGRAFKFYDCWEILHPSDKWNDSCIGKCQVKPNSSRNDTVNAPPPLASLMHDSSGSMNLFLPSSDSSYSQTDTINPNPPNVTTRIESASAEHSSVPTRPHNRKPNWRNNEDIALCQAWVRRSKNPVNGSVQTGYSLWNRVFEDFCEQLPGTIRTKKSLENRWTSIHDDVINWNVIVKRVRKDRSDDSNSADEWRVCYKAFRDEYGHEFKFYHCWEILEHSCSEKSQRKTFSRTLMHDSARIGFDGGIVEPESFMHDLARIGLDGVGVGNANASSSVPSVDDDLPSPSPSPSTPIEPSLERESMKEKRRRIETNTSDEIGRLFECMMLQQNEFQMMQELNKTRFRDMKAVDDDDDDECRAFHLVKKIKLEQVQISVAIVRALGDTEEKMISRAPYLMSDSVLDARATRLKTLHELERKLYEIRRLEYSPEGEGNASRAFEGGKI